VWNLPSLLDLLAPMLVSIGILLIIWFYRT